MQKIKSNRVKSQDKHLHFQRREVSLLKTFLPDKYEYVLFIPMTDVQNRLYEHYLKNNPLEMGGKKLFADYTALRKVSSENENMI